MQKVNEEQPSVVQTGKISKDSSLKAEPSFTPAPWMVIPDTYHRGTISIVAPDATFKGQRYADGLPIATLPSRMGIGEPEYGNGYYEKREDAEGNARLIAAAPALYDALTALLPYLSTEVQLLDYASLNEGGASGFDTASVKARAALAAVAPSAPERETETQT